MAQVYSVQGLLTVSCWTEVEADSMEEAVRIARARRIAEHAIDPSDTDDECWHFGNDGTPDIQVAKVLTERDEG